MFYYNRQRKQQHDDIKSVFVIIYILDQLGQFSHDLSVEMLPGKILWWDFFYAEWHLSLYRVYEDVRELVTLDQFVKVPMHTTWQYEIWNAQMFEKHFCVREILYFKLIHESFVEVQRLFAELYKDQKTNWW